MAKVHFEMDFDAAPAGADDCDIWTLFFYYDTREHSVVLLSAMGAPGASTVTYEWSDFLKLMGQEAGGSYEENIYKLAEAHVELNLDDGLDDA
jgi:hypothetical protein